VEAFCFFHWELNGHAICIYIYIYILHRLLGRLWVIVNVVPTCGNKQQPKIYKQVIWI
jgi:hypothetical protein